MGTIERAARAMYESVQPEWDWDDPDAELLRRMYRDNARAAIGAIREPTDAVVSAGYNELVRYNSAADAWRAMIDVILGEQD
ncbi:hypothetical protein K3M67_18040 (plasmid) [Sphingobium sp. V4]|uniref:hypothetical protein n=1 Tax=Sphingobium sp. V4 TaxID=3038927 RepID=UPI002557FAB9|nr:hypothetical protein [Sphingobium sp. V4]WIW90949.1 hypothetical protein K3M67_18040 [Sphingobium sp. V4]